MLILKGARLTKRIPPTLIGLTGGIAAYYALAYCGLGAGSARWSETYRSPGLTPICSPISSDLSPIPGSCKSFRRWSAAL